MGRRAIEHGLLMESADVARALGVSLSTVRRLVARGELEATLVLASGREVYSRVELTNCASDAARRVHDDAPPVT